MNKLLRAPKAKIPWPPDPRKTKLLFVCWGNVCRSPAAKSIFIRHCRRNRLPPIVVDSAGVCIDEYPPSPSMAMRWAAMIRGYSLASQHRCVYRNDLDEYDLVVAMDQRVLLALETVHRQPSAKIALLSDFLPLGSPRDVPDPMNRSRRTCHYVLDLIETACPAIADLLLDFQIEQTTANTHRDDNDRCSANWKSSGMIGSFLTGLPH